jgi:hypothetical protein
MKTRHGIVVATLIASLALTGPALASGGKGQAAQKQTRSTVQKQQRHQYGSGTQSRIQQDTQAKKGNTYGPGNGTGNQGSGPKDGTGYGAPINR